jgi:RimJ/RimL family protein N-acetyltransferase
MTLRAHLETARLRLRPVVASDEATVVAAINDLAISGWLSQVPHPYTALDFDAFLTDIAYPTETFVIEDATGFAGIIGAGFELGYWLIPRAHGQGYATEAARAVLDMQFAHDESTVAAGYFEGNKRSARVLEKLGFTEIGRSLKPCRALNQSRPHIDLMLTESQFLAATSIEILTPRLRIAPLVANRDWRDIARIGGDPRVAPMMAYLRSPWSEADVCRWLDRSRWAGRLGFRLGVWLRSGELIGTVGLGGEPAPSTAYLLDPAHWGKGLITEAMQVFLPQMMARFDLTEIEADHFTDNPASGAVLRKLGFQQTGTSTGTSLARDGATPMLCYRLRRSGYWPAFATCKGELPDSPSIDTTAQILTNP